MSMVSSELVSMKMLSIDSKSVLFRIPSNIINNIGILVVNIEFRVPEYGLKASTIF